MRAVFFDHCARMSGAEIALLNTVPSLTGTSSLVLLGENGPLVGELESSGIEVSVVEMPSETREFDRKKVKLSLNALAQVFGVIKYSMSVARHIRAFKPDVVVSNSMKGHVIVSMASLWFHTPIVFHVRDRISTDFMSRGGVLLERTLMKVVPRGIVANSRSTLETVPTSRRQKIRTVVASPVLKPSIPISQPNAASQSTIALGIVGRLTEWKGQELAIRAFAMAFPDGSTTLEIVGGPLFGEEEYEKSLHDLVHELGLSSRVTFTGHVEDVYSRMAAWDILVHASIIPEPFGQVVAQGMATGLAVIASGEGGPLETIEDGVTGVLFEPRNMESLSEAMCELAKDASRRSALGEMARENATQYFPEHIGSRMKTAFEITIGTSSLS
ncbi:glycosyltransferase [Arthrobacter sp. 35W]|uniref:glycosyltransferase n=1 Tax=Arthrobacter sp. 35W TaxID=1132441 RepID=UPI00041CDDCB|nr:glycosyltransferase [Arthrobacter sp. 35W]